MKCKTLGAIAIASLHVANLQATVQGQATVILYSVHVVVMRIARYYVIVPRACQISRSKVKPRYSQEILMELPIPYELTMPQGLILTPTSTYGYQCAAKS